LPRSFEAALEALDDDEYLRRVMGEELVSTFLRIKQYELNRARLWNRLGVRRVHAPPMSSIETFAESITVADLEADPFPIYRGCATRRRSATCRRWS
jgi:hypothetical protein